MAKSKLSGVKVVPIDSVKEHPKNPNEHPTAQIQALADSITKYGQYYPIIVDENMTILTGHGKKLALQSTGATKCEIRVISGLNEKQKLKILLEDNKIQKMSHLSYDSVEELIKDIGDADIIGFDGDYINMLLAEENEDVEVVDNTGVVITGNPTSKATYTNTSEPEDRETSEQQVDRMEEIEKGMGVREVVKCPHCGGEIEF